MFEFILSVQLLKGGPVIHIPVHDCKEAIVWIEAAWRWAEHSGLERTQPVYACYRAELDIEVRR
jgi:hypothetical protein